MCYWMGMMQHAGLRIIDVRGTAYPLGSCRADSSNRRAGFKRRRSARIGGMLIERVPDKSATRLSISFGSKNGRVVRQKVIDQ
jgi:hypothetical protein